MTAEGPIMHAAAKEAKSLQQQVRELESANREFRQWIAASIGQFRYAQWLLTEPVHTRSPQIDEFIQKLEGALK